MIIELIGLYVNHFVHIYYPVDVRLSHGCHPQPPNIRDGTTNWLINLICKPILQ